MRNPLNYFMIAQVSICSLGAIDSYAQEQQRPNVVVISVDDMRDYVGYLGGYGGQIFTPNIDQLASEGVAFTNAHTAAPVCCPSRNAFMLGKRPSTTGLYNNQQWYKANRPKDVALPEFFRKNGYEAAGAGKVFHHTPGNNPPSNWDDFQDQVFDNDWRHHDWGVERYFITYGFRGAIKPAPEWHPLNEIFPPKGELDWGFIPDKKPEAYGDVQVVRYAQDFFKKPHNAPFFIALGIFRPHLPWYVPKQYFDLYPIESIILPKVNEDDLDDLSPAGKKMAGSSSKDFRRIRDEGKWKDAVQAYLGSITFADDQVGAILDALAESPFAKNTIVILWSDHGYHLGTKDHWHKKTLWEEATRIPFVIKAPGFSGNGQLCNRPVDMTSVYPTLGSLCGFQIDQPLDGQNLSPLLEDPDREWDTPAVTVYEYGNAAIRSQRWRYIRYEDGSEELYDHITDPLEWNNLAHDDAYTEIINEHRKWVPGFAEPAESKNKFLFDPYAYTWLHRESKQFIDGKE